MPLDLLNTDWMNRRRNLLDFAPAYGTPAPMPPPASVSTTQPYQYSPMPFYNADELFAQAEAKRAAMNQDLAAGQQARAGVARDYAAGSGLGALLGALAGGDANAGVSNALPAVHGVKAMLDMNSAEDAKQEQEHNQALKEYYDTMTKVGGWNTQIGDTNTRGQAQVEAARIAAEQHAAQLRANDQDKHLGSYWNPVTNKEVLILQDKSGKIFERASEGQAAQPMNPNAVTPDERNKNQAIAQLDKITAVKEAQDTMYSKRIQEVRDAMAETGSDEKKKELQSTLDGISKEWLGKILEHHGNMNSIQKGAGFNVTPLDENVRRAATTAGITIPSSVGGPALDFTGALYGGK